MNTALPLYIVLRFKQEPAVISNSKMIGNETTSTDSKIQRLSILAPECLVDIRLKSFHWCTDPRKALYYVGLQAANNAIQDIKARSTSSAEHTYIAIQYEYAPLQNSQTLSTWTIEQLACYLTYGFIGVEDEIP